jgi:hypothetical protein
MTAIVTEAAARSTVSGTVPARVALYCHWYGTPAEYIAVRPGSAAENRRSGTSTETIPGSFATPAAKAPGFAGRTSAARTSGSRLTTRAGYRASAARNAAPER